MKKNDKWNENETKNSNLNKKSAWYGSNLNKKNAWYGSSLVIVIKGIQIFKNNNK